MVQLVVNGTKVETQADPGMPLEHLTKRLNR